MVRRLAEIGCCLDAGFAELGRGGQTAPVARFVYGDVRGARSGSARVTVVQPAHVWDGDDLPCPRRLDLPRNRLKPYNVIWTGHYPV